MAQEHGLSKGLTRARGPGIAGPKGFFEPEGFSLPDSIEKFCDSTYFFATPCIFESMQLLYIHLRLHCDSMRVYATSCPSRSPLYSPLFVTGSDTLQTIYMCIMNRILYVIVHFQALTSFKKYICIFHAFLATLCICDSMRLHDFF